MELNFGSIETERLIIREIQHSDAQDIFNYRADPKVYIYQCWRPRTIEDVVEFINNNMLSSKDISNHWHNFAIVYKADNNLIGDIGMNLFDSDGLQLEIGYTLSPFYQGKGYATESIKAIMDYAFNTFNIHRIIASMDPRNIKSENLAQRLGMRLEAHHIKNIKSDNEWFDTLVYAILKEEYLIK
jgi:RimJ/RimL family protein N-acetyltransferase